MNPDTRPPVAPALDLLRRFARPRPDGERCELCAAALGPGHAHLIEPAARRLVCACDPCAFLFGHDGAAKYRRVPRRVEALPGLRLTDLQWEALGLPVKLAFFLHSSAAGRVVAVYPSPGGATEAAADAEAWAEIVRDNPALRDLPADVEAVLANRVGGAGEYYHVGVDECYRLVGLVRTHWRGFSGGAAVWDEIGRFFADLRDRARPAGGTHAP